MAKLISIKYKGKLLFIRRPTIAEQKHFNSLKPSLRYSKYLGLIINKKIGVNDFTGDIQGLQELIKEIRKGILR